MSSVVFYSPKVAWEEDVLDALSRCDLARLKQLGTHDELCEAIDRLGWHLNQRERVKVCAWAQGEMREQDHQVTPQNYWQRRLWLTIARACTPAVTF